MGVFLIISIKSILQNLLEVFLVGLIRSSILIVRHSKRTLLIEMRDQDHLEILDLSENVENELSILKCGLGPRSDSVFGLLDHFSCQVD